MLFIAVCEWQATISRFEDVLAYARNHDHVRFESLALGNMGIAYLHLGQYNKAIELAERHLDIAQRIGDKKGEGNALALLGSAHMQLGDYRKALEFYEKYEKTHQMGDSRGQASAQGLIGIVHNYLGKYDMAV